MGTATMEDFLKAAPRFSLKDMGLLDKASAPILGVNGKLDDQAPVEDIYLLMEHGSPKEARIYPEGRHMGRTPGMPADEITRMIATWLKEKLVRQSEECRPRARPGVKGRAQTILASISPERSSSSPAAARGSARSTRRSSRARAPA